MVAFDERPDPLVPGVGRRGQGARPAALRGIRRVPPVLEAQPQDGEEARDEAGRSVPRRHSFPIPGRPGALAAVVAQLPRLRSISGALPRREDPADQTCRSMTWSRRGDLPAYWRIGFPRRRLRPWEVTTPPECAADWRCGTSTNGDENEAR